MKTLEERLEAVSAAIDSILAGGQNVSYEGRSVGKPDIKALQEEERRLEMRIARKQRGGGIRTRGGAPL